MKADFLKKFNNEYIAIDGNLFRIKVELISFDKIELSEIKRLHDLLDTDPIANFSLSKLGILDPIERIKKYALCNFGGFDDKPDLDSQGITNHEYYECGLRGSCPVEGKLCKSIKVANGFLTPREIQVCRLISKDRRDKEIADELGMENNTVTTHIQNITRKTGFNRAGIAALSIKLNL